MDSPKRVQIMVQQEVDQVICEVRDEMLDMLEEKYGVTDSRALINFAIGFESGVVDRMVADEYNNTIIDCFLIGLTTVMSSAITILEESDA